MQQYNERRFKLNYPNAKLGVILSENGYIFSIIDGDNVLYSENRPSQIEMEEVWENAYSALHESMKYDLVIEKCKCKCHTPGVVMMHCMPCCSDNGENYKRIKL